MKNEIQQEFGKLNTRRWFLQRCGVGMAGIALNSLFSNNAIGATTQDPLSPRLPHFAPTAKRVIYIFQAGAPSHIDLFDHKPELVKRNGELPPAELLGGGLVAGLLRLPLLPLRALPLLALLRRLPLAHSRPPLAKPRAPLQDVVALLEAAQRRLDPPRVEEPRVACTVARARDRTGVPGGRR